MSTGRGTSTNYALEAGYQQSDGYISLSTPSDVNLLPVITTLQGGAAYGSAVWTVTTDNPTGYTLYIKADSSPAMQSGANFFANYTPSGSLPDYTWTIGIGNSEFGFSPEGADIWSTYKDNGTACGVGTSDAVSACWDSITTTNKLVGKGISGNHPTGTNTTVRFEAEAEATANQAAGSYSAHIIVTAIAI